MLYWQIETEQYGDDEPETYRRLVDTNPDPQPKVYSNRRLDYELATKENTSVDDILIAIGNEVENENYHSMTGIADFVVLHLYKFLSDEQVKDILWSMVESKGLAWISF